MIHSCAGGNLKEYKTLDLVKVYFVTDKTMNFFWYICPFEADVGDIVFAPYGLIDQLREAKIVEIKKNCSSQILPIPYNKLKRVFKQKI